jgi:hypothetical protein
MISVSDPLRVRFFS